MVESSAGNLPRRMDKAFLPASAGSLLLMIFRIRHAWTKLVYCHGLLAVCLLLPLLQPWRHPLIVGESSAAADVRIPEGRLVLWLLAAGAAVKLCWLLGG